jgi:hypothetical protein
MKKKAKITIALIAVLIVSITMIGLMSFYNPLVNPAATPTPISRAAINALVIYDPNDTITKNFVQEVAKDLEAKNYMVTLAKSDSSAVNHTTGYHIIIIGGRFEDGKFLNSTQYALHSLVMDHDYHAKAGVFTVQDSLSADDWVKINWCLPIFSDHIYSVATRIQLTPEDNIAIKAQDFVNQIIEATPSG